MFQIRIRGPIPWILQKSWRLSLVAFVIFSIAMAINVSADYVLSKRGKVIGATITGEYGKKKKMVTCTYEVKGIVYPALASTPRDLEYSPLMIGTTVLVTYDPFNPKTSVGGDKRGRFFEEYSVGITLLCLLCAFVAYVSTLARKDIIPEPRPNPK